jgi:hypothetical protein
MSNFDKKVQPYLFSNKRPQVLLLFRAVLNHCWLTRVPKYTYNKKQVCKVLRKNSHLKFRLSGMYKLLQQTAQKQLLSPRRGIRYNKIPIPQKGGGE